jgi:hypothetical protein
MSKVSKKREYVEFLALVVVLFTAVTIVGYYGGLYTQMPPPRYEMVEIVGVKIIHIECTHLKT